MARLVDPQLAPGDPHSRDTSERGVLDLPGELNPPGPQFGHGGFDVIAHEEELMPVLTLRRMHPEHRRRQGEDQPATPDIDRRELHDVAQERPGGLRLRGEDEGVHAGDHGASLAPGVPEVEMAAGVARRHLGSAEGPRQPRRNRGCRHAPDSPGPEGLTRGFRTGV